MTITETEFNHATRPPRNTAIPDCFTPPADLAELIAARDHAYAEWVEVEDAATGAWLAVDQAKRGDRQALIDAVSAGKGDPGTKATEKAERALVVALERVRQAQVKAHRADGAVAQSYKASMQEFIPQAIAHARNGMDRYTERINQARAMVAEAANELRGSFIGLQEIRDHVAPVMLYAPPSVVPHVKIPDPAQEFVRPRELCDRIEQRTEQLEAKLDRRSPTTAGAR